MSVGPTPGATGHADVAARYEIRVGGHLDERWSPDLGGLALDHRSDGSTSLTGTIVDQAQLHGVLTRVRDLGLPLLAVRRID